MNTIVITVDGVLRHTVGHDPIPAGKLLALALVEHFNLALITDEIDTALLDHWLLSEGYPAIPYLMPRQVGDPEGPEGRALQLRRLAALGCNVNLVIEPNPAVAAHLMGLGHITLCWLHPTFARPEFRPDYDGAIRPWEHLVGEVERLQLMRNQAARSQESDQ